MLPAHVILASLCDDGTAAARWLTGTKHPAARNWARHLGDRIFGADLPATHIILGLHETAIADPGHQERIAHATRAKPTASRTSPTKWLAPAIVAAILLLLPGTMNLAYTIQTWLSGRGALGLVLGTSPRPGALIITVQPGSPASRAGLRSGDTITALAGTPVKSANAAILAIQAHPPGTHISLTIVRHGRHMTVSAVLAKPTPAADPGYIGVTMHSDPPEGALVISVTPGAPAATAGLLPGDVITAVSGIADGGSSEGTVMLIQHHHPGQIIRLSILRNGQPVNLNVTLSSPPEARK